MKRLLILSVLFSNFVFAMEAPPSRKRVAEEEQPSSAQKVKREAEQAAIIREPAIPMEAQRELSPEVQAQVNYLRSVAERGEFPNEIAAQILKNLAKVKVRGATEEQKLYNAIANIRAFMEAFPQFYGDVGINGYLIQELAKRYAQNARIKVAIALATTGAGRWLVGYFGNDSLKGSNFVDYFVEAASTDLGTINFILAYFPQIINERGAGGLTALMTAAIGEEIEIIERLLKAPEIDVNKRDETGDTALIIAALNGRTHVVERLLQVPGINVDVQNKDGLTALMIAAANGNTQVVDQLLQVAGIDVNQQDARRFTPLIFAAEYGHMATVERLLAVPGIDVNKSTDLGDTALMFAVLKGYAAIVKRLLAVASIDVNKRNSSGDTALIWAAQEGHTEIVERLLQVPSINVNMQNQSGDTALMVAADEDHIAIVERLLQIPGIDVNARTKFGETALGVAVRKSNNPNKDAIIKRLIEFGAVE